MGTGGTTTRYGPIQVDDDDEPSGFRLVLGQKYEGQFVKSKRCGHGKQWCGNAEGEPPFDVYLSLIHI